MFYASGSGGLLTPERPAPCPCLGTGLVATKETPDAIELDFCSCRMGPLTRKMLEEQEREDAAHGGDR